MAGARAYRLLEGGMGGLYASAVARGTGCVVLKRLELEESVQKGKGGVGTDVKEHFPVLCGNVRAQMYLS